MAWLVIGLGLIPAFVAYKQGRNFWLWWLFGACCLFLALPIVLLLGPNIEVLQKRQTLPLSAGDRGVIFIVCVVCVPVVALFIALARSNYGKGFDQDRTNVVQASTSTAAQVVNTSPGKAVSQRPILTSNEQETFEKKRHEYYLKYQQQPNDISRSNVFNESSEWSKKFLTTECFSEWRGSLDSIVTQKGGGKALVTIKSMRQGFGVSYSMSIMAQNPLYQQLAAFPEGSNVVFSGRFSSSEERSITEGGSMREPEFSVELDSITQNLIGNANAGQ